ncbi:hypothetical protein BGW38_002118, partial [Lunasporangiospora selenospora]
MFPDIAVSGPAQVSAQAVPASPLDAVVQGPATVESRPAHESRAREKTKDSKDDDDLAVDDALGNASSSEDIASDVQERSQLSEVGSDLSDAGDEDNLDVGEEQLPSAEDNPTAVWETPVDRGSNDTPLPEVLNDATGQTGIEGTGVATTTITAAAAIAAATSTTIAVAGTGAAEGPPSSAQSLRQQPGTVPLGTTSSSARDGEPSSQNEGEDVSTELATSYTSPNHEWAPVLQRRLFRGLHDAQMLTRSSSMLASPSILAQSLVQVKEASALSPGSSGKEYQTAEELFDRPAAIEPSPSYHEKQHPRDDPFPSSAFSSNSPAQLLLFAPLNPDQLFKKGSSTAQPSAPLQPPTETQVPPVDQSNVQAMPATAQLQPSHSTTQPSSHHQQQTHLTVASLPPMQQVPGLASGIAQPHIPMAGHSPSSAPLRSVSHPPVAASPLPKSFIISPAGYPLTQSPLVAKDLGATPGA